MASVDKPRYGVEVKYKNGAKTTMWRRTKEEQSRVHREMNANPAVKTAKRVER